MAINYRTSRGNRIVWEEDRVIGKVNREVVKHMRPFAQKIRDDARALAPKGRVTRGASKTGKHAGKSWTARQAGALRKSIKVKRLKSRFGGTDRYIVTVGDRVGNIDCYYWKYIEFGIEKGRGKQKASRPGFPHKPFMIPAVKKQITNFDEIEFRRTAW